MPNFDSRFWNLSQAAGWVIYRKRKLVEDFSQQSADGWRALLIFPNMHKFERIGYLDELVNALIRGDLTAWGRRNDIKDQLEAIPAHEWNDLRISPPVVTRAHSTAGQIEPWTGLRFESSDLKKRWRGLLEIEGRTHFKWDVLKKMWHEVNDRLPDASQNEKILEVQSEYHSKYGRSPSRSTIQMHIKQW